MTTPTLFKEYIWLVNTIYQAGNITFSDINKKWLKTEMSGGVELARSTFNRHKIAVEDIFGINIECDRSNGYKYYIGNAEIYFIECFVVVRDEDVKPEKIIIMAFGIESNYLRDLPLHHSQREIANTEDK